MDRMTGEDGTGRRTPGPIDLMQRLPGATVTPLPGGGLALAPGRRLLALFWRIAAIPFLLFLLLLHAASAAPDSAEAITPLHAALIAACLGAGVVRMAQMAGVVLRRLPRIELHPDRIVVRQESGVTVLPNDQVAQIETEVRHSKGLTWRLLRFLHQAEPPRGGFVRPTCQVDVTGLARSDAALEALEDVLRSRLRPARMTGAEAEARRAALLDSRVSAGPGRWVAVGLGAVAGLALHVLQPWSLL